MRAHSNATWFPTSSLWRGNVSSKMPDHPLDPKSSLWKGNVPSKTPDHPWNVFKDHLWNDCGEVWNVVKFMQGPHVATKRPYWKHPNRNRSQIARFGALTRSSSCLFAGFWEESAISFLILCQWGMTIFSQRHAPLRSGQPLPSLSFLSLLFWKKARKTIKKTRIFCPYWTPKIPRKEGRIAQKNKEILAREKTRNSKKTRKGRTGLQLNWEGRQWWRWKLPKEESISIEKVAQAVWKVKKNQCWDLPGLGGSEERLFFRRGFGPETPPPRPGRSQIQCPFCASPMPEQNLRLPLQTTYAKQNSNWITMERKNW